MKRGTIILTLSILLTLSSHVLYGEERGITLIEAINIATKVVPGEAIKAELERGVYEVKILTRGGRVEKVYVDVRDGRVFEDKYINLDSAISIALKEVPGEVVKVEFEKGMYEIKIRTGEGRVVEVYVDARDGNIIKRKEKRGYGRDDD